MTTTAESKTNRVLIEGVPGLAWGTGKDCTFAGALAAAMSVTEHPYSYAELMGLSGLAFRVRWSNDETPTKWCPSDYLHWYVTVVPRVTQSAGFELGSGMFINTALPEESAAFLRSVAV